MIAVCCNCGFNCQAGNVDLDKLRISADAANGFARARATYADYTLSHRKGGNRGDDAILDLESGDKVIARCLCGLREPSQRYASQHAKRRVGVPLTLQIPQRRMLSRNLLTRCSS